METTETGQPTAEPITTCFKHSRRETKVRCSRCDRYICPDCMREAPVGFRCPECVRNENRSMRPVRTVFGGKLARRQYVTYALIAVTLLAYLAELAYPVLVDRFGNLGVGLVGPDGERYLDDGEDYAGYAHEGVAYGQWYRLFTSAFLHLPGSAGALSLAHIVLNLYWLWALGRILEEQLGWWRFLSVYLLSALGGSVLGFVVDPSQSAVGASGAIFGLAACYFVVAARMGQQPMDRQRLILIFVVWMVVSAGFTSWQGHLGGLITGGLLGLALAYAPRAHQRAVHLGVFAFTLAVLAAAVVVKAAELTA